ncbi:MAG TPA: NAD(P)-dependent oxidoreductase [Gemmatimonadaceae bacterium]|nr:NAD(P)-dependent oxidoreductase [Gemmatimonadaceae bacterium]
MIPGILQQDLDAALERSRDLFVELSGARLLITGSTGMVGTLMLESVAHARARTGADIRVAALARDARRLHQRLPWIKDARWIEVAEGDVRSFVPISGAFDLVVHAANTASPAEISADPDGIARVVVEGSRHVHDIAAAAGARRFLQLSSGSVSGSHFTPAPLIDEDDPGTPEGGSDADRLARAKAVAERELLSASGRRAPAVVFARGFALAGPWLPLDSDFAFGNFVGAALAGRSIRVNGDGTPQRSYLYSRDLVTWLWTLLLRGVPGRAYNVGSEHAVSIGDLARQVAALVGGTIEIVRTPALGARAHWHVPNTQRARTEFGLEETVTLSEAIVRTAAWWRERLALGSGAPESASSR